MLNEINKTLYIPLYGKALVSKSGLIIKDEKAEEIVDKEQIAFKGKSGSKWLAYYMGIRSAVFDDWTREKISESKDSVIIHIGCGLDSRFLRVGNTDVIWYDVDFPDVIELRKKYYRETEKYRMIKADIRDTDWLSDIKNNGSVTVIAEGLSMYLKPEELLGFFKRLSVRFEKINLLMDFYTVMAAEMSKYKNPVNDVGVTEVYGTDNPEFFNFDNFRYIREHVMTPEKYINELSPFDKTVFKKLYAGKLSNKLYKLYEFTK